MARRSSAPVLRQRLLFPPRGGKRRGAGRPPAGEKAGVSHASRTGVRKDRAVLVTVSLIKGLPFLRHREPMQVIFGAFGAVNRRRGFRVVHYSVQGNHLHLLVEADDSELLGRGMCALLSRLVRGLNRLWNRRGKLLRDRYHSRALASPREVYHALRYLFHNAHKHGLLPPSIPDPFTSMAFFRGVGRRRLGL